MRLPDFILVNLEPDYDELVDVHAVVGDAFAFVADDDVPVYPSVKEAVDAVVSSGRRPNVLPALTSMEDLSLSEVEIRRLITGDESGEIRDFLLGVYDLLNEVELKMSSWQATARDYHENPDSFFTSYYFAHSHPALWTRSPSGSGVWKTENTFHNTYPYPINGDDEGVDGVGWCIEAGGHVLPDCDIHYHDVRIDAYGDSIEAAYIDLAHNIAAVFEDDGTERVNPSQRRR